MRTPLDPDDLDRLATAAYLIGEDVVSVQTRTRAHAGFLERGETIRAARSAFWLAFTIFDRPSQRAQAAGWLARAQRLIDDVKEPCVEQGWLLCASARQRAAAGDIASAHAAFTQAAEIGARFGNSDLMALARHGQGRALLAMNQTTAGLALLDEVMVAVTGGEVAPMVAGAVYCSVITACHDLFDLRRAQEWTTALQGWCASHPDVVPFRGYCLIRRSELMQLHGAWQDAFSEARRACERLTDPPSQPEAGAAYYQVAELHRLRGEFAKADEAYRLASQAGGKPHPGLALLRLSQGQIDAADAAIRLALQETRGGRARILLLCAGVEIMLARNDVTGARASSDELVRLAGRLDLPFLRAVSSQARGAVALAEGQPLSALESLRAAWVAWQELDAPYELAQIRVLIGLAYRQLGDGEGAHLEFEAAHEAFKKLGATPAAARVAAFTAQASPPESTGLTGREIEVLRLVATGVTNRTIAARLGISEKTVARHVSNIFTKLDLSSRAAATAYAYEHNLL
ncbi:MAG TPA: LuxR C-terminal-related transcriptional regulator [bacterium]|nr:LuxR C-terminal-related transcriptional regulator [bacterium]